MGVKYRGNFAALTFSVHQSEDKKLFVVYKDTYAIYSKVHPVETLHSTMVAEATQNIFGETSE